MSPRSTNYLTNLAAMMAIAVTAWLGGYVLPAAGASPARGGDLRVAVPQLPAALDPVVSTLGTNWLVAANVCEGLFALDDNWQPQPMLAESYQYDPDGLSLTVKLRSGIKFHSGATLTADDVVASLLRYAQSAGTGAVLKSLVTDIKATGPDTVVISLSQPTGILPGLLTLTPASILSRQALAGHSASDPVRDLDGTGPYKVTQFQPDKQALLTRFDGYQARSEPSSGSAGAKHAYADRLIFIPQAEPSVRRDGLFTGGIDVATTVPFDFYGALKNNAATQPVVIQESQSLTMVFNTKQGPTANVKLRQAIYHALDMGPIMLAAVGNPEFFVIDPSWVPDRKSIWYTKSGADNFGKPDPALVKRLLQEAGYHGETLRWLASKDFYQDHYLPALTAQQQLEKFGIKIDLKVMPAATYIQARSDPKQFEVFPSFLPTYVDPVVIPYLNSTYPGFWSDPHKEELVKQLATTTDQKARIGIWQQIQAYVYEQAPFIKFGTEAALSAARKGVAGVETSPANTQAFFNTAPARR
ncbi:MAG: hypothetical protein JO069_21175 [Verrucomicrobia bacterium]|nr:hypothetical protein [Verrucomicrobiota bacterium]